jgi:hypothetical protein
MRSVVGFLGRHHGCGSSTGTGSGCQNDKENAEPPPERRGQRRLQDPVVENCGGDVNSQYALLG